jgi:hypothetical protein
VIHPGTPSTSRASTRPASLSSMASMTMVVMLA